VQVDIGKERRDYRALPGSPFTDVHDPVFQHARLSHFWTRRRMRGNVGLTKVVVLMFMAPDRRQATLAFGWDTAKPKGGVRKSSVRFPSVGCTY